MPKNTVSVVLLTLFSVLIPAGPVPAGAPEGGWDTKTSLERILRIFPRNHAAAYYLGMVCLRTGDLDGAVAAWEAYLALAPDDAKSAVTRELLTLVRLERARRFAKATAKKDPAELASRVGPRTVAVLSFSHDGSRENRLLAKGLAAMLITDLSRLSGITVVEREKMQFLLQEMALGETGVVEQRTAAKTGRLLLAGRLVRGEVVGAGDISISAVTLDTLRAEETGSVRRRGPRSSVFALEGELFAAVVRALGLNTASVPGAASQSRGTSYRAFLSYCEGLDAMDRGDFRAAGEAFGRAHSLDPLFDMALDALLALPRRFSWEDLETLAQFAETHLTSFNFTTAAPTWDAVEAWITQLTGGLDPAVVDELLGSQSEESAQKIIQDYLDQFGFTLPPIP